MLRFNQRYLNKLTIKLAGRGYFADLEHIGRKPGVTDHTPIMAFRHGDTLTIALTYGPNVRWLKNIRAAGHCSKSFPKARSIAVGAGETMVCVDRGRSHTQSFQGVLLGSEILSFVVRLTGG